VTQQIESISVMYFELN